MAKQAQPDAIIRADHFQQRTDRDEATPANNAGYVPTNDDDGYTHGNHIGPNAGTVKCESVLPGTGNPKALHRLGDVFTLARGDAKDYGGYPTSFSGFSKDTNATGTFPTLLDATDINDGTNYSSPAGDRRLLVVAIALIDGSQTGSNVSAVTAGGVSMIAAGTSSGNVIGGWDSGHYGIWYLPIGDSGTADDRVIDIVYSGTPDAVRTETAITLENIDQNAPLLFGAGYNSSTGTITGDVSFPNCYAVAVGTGSGNWNLDNTLNDSHYGEIVSHDTVTLSGGFRVGAIGFFRMATEAVSDTIEMLRGPFITGFSSLTSGGLYTLSLTTPGEIELNGDGPAVGIAKSATELWMFDPPKQRANGVFTGNSDQTLSIGFRPSVVRVHAANGSGASQPVAANSWGSWNPYTGNSSSWSGSDNSQDGIGGTSGNVIYLRMGASPTTAIVDNITGTSFRINFTASNTTAYTHWEAEE